ncbi:hypothetical protein AVTE2539_14570 [Acidovorax sp. SUPP2539]|nr:hypothetical protein AVTE2539_14570 [Acidovorax sp. SUPP2539]
MFLDLCTRKVVGWSMKATLGREPAFDALLMAVWRRKSQQGILVHSEQASQYESDDFKRFCTARNLEQSMDRGDN